MLKCQLGGVILLDHIRTCGKIFNQPVKARDFLSDVHGS